MSCNFVGKEWSIALSYRTSDEPFGDILWNKYAFFCLQGWTSRNTYATGDIPDKFCWSHQDLFLKIRFLVVLSFRIVLPLSLSFSYPKNVYAGILFSYKVNNCLREACEVVWRREEWGRGEKLILAIEHWHSRWQSPGGADHVLDASWWYNAFSYYTLNRLPNQQEWDAKWKLSSNIHTPCIRFLPMFGTELCRQLALIYKTWPKFCSRKLGADFSELCWRRCWLGNLSETLTGLLFYYTYDTIYSTLCVYRPLF